MQKSICRIVWTIFVCLAPMADAVAGCGDMPTVYFNGNATDTNGACTALATGQIAAATIELSKKQDASLLNQAAQIAKQVVEIQNLVIQTEMMINDLAENPLQVVAPDINQIIANQNRINNLTNKIAQNSSHLGENLMKNLKHPDTIGLGHGSRFALWSEARRANVEESTAKVTQFVKDMQNENMSMTQAIKNISATHDKTATLKATGNIAGQQLQQLSKMTEILNQLMGAKAIEDGILIEHEITGAQVQEQMAKEGLGPKLDIPPESYRGPGTTSSQPF